MWDSYLASNQADYFIDSRWCYTAGHAKSRAYSHKINSALTRAIQRGHFIIIARGFSSPSLADTMPMYAASSRLFLCLSFWWVSSPFFLSVAKEKILLNCDKAFSAANDTYIIRRYCSPPAITYTRCWVMSSWTYSVDVINRVYWMICFISFAYLEGTEDAGLAHTGMSGQFSKTSPEYVEVPENLQK